MNDTPQPATRPKSSTTKAVLLIIFMILLVILVGVTIARLGSSDDSDMPNNSQASDTDTPSTSPDRVKENSGPNGDTTPSSDGTGQGSNNSLLGQ
jgi:flagellar basal body-associated protein FliL